MPVDLSIKKVPEDLARRLRKRAQTNHRSLQGELMAILQQATGASSATAASMVREPVATAYGRANTRRVAPASESALIIRQAREGRMFSIVDLHRFVSALASKTPDEATGWIRQERSRR